MGTKKKNYIITGIFGSSGSGKTTFANFVAEWSRAPIFLVREHYREFLLPRYKKRFPLFRERQFNRELTIEIANWFYSDAKSNYLDVFIEDINPPSKFILDGLRHFKDLIYLNKKFNAMVIYMYADLSTRLERQISVGHELLKGKNDLEIREILNKEWKFWDFDKCHEYALKNRSVIIDTSKAQDIYWLMKYKKIIMEHMSLF